MTLKEYIDEETRRLTAFATYWEKQAKDNPQAFPNEMLQGDWDDQFYSFSFCEVIKKPNIKFIVMSER
jgi:hypothetical protein